MCIWALAADTDAEARRLLRTREHWRVGFEQGIREPLMDPDEVAQRRYTDAEQARIDALRQRAFVGTADAVAERLTAEARRLELDELVVVTWTHDPAARERSYELLAQAFGLTG